MKETLNFLVPFSRMNLLSEEDFKNQLGFSDFKKSQQGPCLIKEVFLPLLPKFLLSPRSFWLKKGNIASFWKQQEMLVNIFIKRLWTGGGQCRGKQEWGPLGWWWAGGGELRESGLCPSLAHSQTHWKRTECKLRQQEEILQMTLPDRSCRGETRPVNKTSRPAGGLC